MSSSFYSSSGSAPDIYSSASDSASAASNSATQAAASLTEFKSLYMGSFQSAPTATQDGSLYYNEVTNLLYYWNSVAWTATNTSAANTDAIAEGSANLYFTSERVDDRVNALLQAGSNVTLTYDDVANTLTIASTGGGGANLAQSTTDDLAEGTTNKYFNGKTTSDLAEGTNLYFTAQRATSIITGSDLDMSGNKVLFANMYSAEGNLPSASTYHGMFAHVHATGKGYFAHGNSWHKLLDETSSTTTDLTEGSNLYYTDERVDDRVNALLTAGSNISLTYNDAANTLTIASTGGGGSGSSTFTGLTDTPATLGTSGQMLAVNSGGTALEFVAAPSGGGATTLSGLTDVSSATPSNGQVLTYDTTTSLWQPITPSSGGGSGSSTFTGLTDTPSSFTATKFLRANSGGTALEYATVLTPSNLTVTNNAASGGGSVSYIPGANGATLSFIPPDLSSYIGLTDISLTASGPSGGGSLSYNNTTGAFSYTPADVSGFITGITGESLYSLSNVYTSSSPTDGQVLTWDNANSYWKPTTVSSGGSSFAGANYFKVNTTANTAASATGLDSIAIGRNSTSSQNDTIAIGRNATNAATGSILIGATAFTTSNGTEGVSIGYNSNVSSTGGVALGGGANVTYNKNYSTSLGYGAVASAANQLTLGANNATYGFTSILVGNSSYTPTVSMDLTTKDYVDTAVAGAGGIALTDLSAPNATASGIGSLHYNNTTGVFTFTPPDLSSYITATSTTTFTNKSGNISQWTNDSGYLTAITGQSLYSLSNVNTSSSPTDGQVLTWDNTNSYWSPTTVSAGSSFAAADYVKVDPAFANPATVSGSDSISIGRNTQIASDYSIAIGSTGFTTSGANYSTALGYNANSQSAGGVAIGALSGVGTNESYSTALGYNAGATTTNQLMLGANNTTYGFTSILVGNSSYTPTQSMDLTTKDYVDTAVAGAGGGGGGITGIALDSNTTASTASGIFSMAIGSSASATATASIAIGYEAQAANSRSVSIGYNAGKDQGQSGFTNSGIAIGDRCITNSRGYYPVAIGFFAETFGDGGVAIGSGRQSGSSYYRTTAGTYGVGIGYSAFAQQNSVGIGKEAGAFGATSTAVGASTYASGTNATALGYNALSTSSNKFVLGNGSVSDLRCQDTGISAVSDHRDKTQVEALSIGLDFVNAIEPKAYYKNNRTEYYVPVYTDEQLGDDPELEQSYTFDQANYDAATEKFTKREFGFVAQDVEAQLPEAYSDARVSFGETDEIYGFDVQRFTPADMLPIAWKALRELSDKHNQLQSDYDALLARVVALENA